MEEREERSVEKCLKCDETIEFNAEWNHIDCYLCKRWAHATCFDIDEATINNFRSIRRHGFRWICQECDTNFYGTNENRDKTDEVQAVETGKLKEKMSTRRKERKKTPRKLIRKKYALEEVDSSGADPDYSPESIETNDSKPKKGKKTRPSTEDDVTEINQNARDTDIELQQNADATDGGKPLSCKLCGKVYSYKSGLRRHLKRHEGTFECSDCGKTCDSASALKEHRISHTSKKPFSCDICSKKFPRNCDLAKHVRKRHPDKKPAKLQCNTCDVVFTKKLPLWQHEKTVHGTPCSVCGKRFLSISDLTNHFNSHDDSEKPVFICEICGKSFFNKDYLTRHMHIHKGEKSHLCDICGKGFLKAGALGVHKQTHQDEKLSCSLCSKTFSCKRYLADHQRFHKNELTCDICFKTFAQCGGLVRHRSIHTGEKPHSCGVCFKRFRTRQGLKQHERQRGVHSGFSVPEAPSKVETPKDRSVIGHPVQPIPNVLNMQPIYFGERLDSYYLTL